MKVKEFRLGFLLALALIYSSQAQTEEQHVHFSDYKQIVQLDRIVPQSPDSLYVELPDSTEMNLIPDIRTVFERQNKMYSTPKSPGKNLLRILKKDELEISNEAMYWAKLVRDPSYYFDEQTTFRDTIIVDPIFLPIVYKGKPFSDQELTFYSMDFMKPQFKETEVYQPTAVFEDYLEKKKSGELAVRYVEEKYPFYIHYTEKQMPNELVKTDVIKKDTYENLQLKVENEADFSDVTPVKFIPERRYWTSGFESAVQFSQNYISDNWYKGGSSNLNLYTKNVLSYNYSKDKVQITNQIEYRTSIYTAPKDTIHAYKVGDDVLRLSNNIGYKAFNKWSYTFDTEIKTQIFQNYKENTEQKQAALLAPVTATFGLGMKYNLTKQFKNKHKKLVMAVNLAPLSLTYMYSRLKNADEIDLGRHGFTLDEETNTYKNSFTQLGSSINSSLTFNFNRNVTWQSRLTYFTSYNNVKMEFENTLTMAISRFFSTRIYLNVRYDDTATVKDPDFNYFQVNELMSFGFNYKW